MEITWKETRERETRTWQGHKPAQGFDPPKGYLIQEEELDAKLKDLINSIQNWRLIWLQVV